MTNRILLNAGGLKISNPGADVLTAAGRFLHFSSDWSQLGQYAQGSATTSWAVSGEVGTWTQSIGLGKTFASPPQVFFERDLGGGKFCPLGGASGFTYSVTDTSLGGTPRYFWVIAEVTTSQIILTARYDKRTSGWTQPQFTTRYTVFQYNI